VAVLLAGLTALAAGLGQKTADWITKSDSPLLSYGVEEMAMECGSVTYLPNPVAGTTVRRPPPFELSEWGVFMRQPEAEFASSDLVQVSIQGESARTITLTGIEFEVTRQERRKGAVFSAACGDAIHGRGVEVDLEANPPQVVSSSDSSDGIVTAGGQPGSGTRPISFPWTVSLTDPLLLYVLTTARSCDCLWAARIPWVSGGEKGTIHIDDGGDPYRVVGSDGLAAYSSSGTDWQRYR
jgi:hypothetical protein